MVLSTSLAGVSPDQTELLSHYWVLSMEISDLLQQASWAWSSMQSDVQENRSYCQGMKGA